RCGLTSDEWEKALAFVAVGRSDAGERAECWENVEQITKRVAALAGGNTWAGEDERFVRGVVVDVLFAEQAVTAYCQPVVAGEDDDRVAELAAGLEGVKDASDLVVQ